MKRTKSMYYCRTSQSDELFLYTVNTGIIYTEYTSPLIELLRKHYKKGVYSKNKAIDAYYKIATFAAKLYNKEFASDGYRSFSVTDRFTVAIEMEQRYYEQVIVS